jgi:ankyrin repeat domain-containing protein 50
LDFDCPSRFRWVELQLESLKNCILPSDVKKVLKSLPKSLDDTYKRILKSIDEQHRQKAVVALQWISHACPLVTIEELAEAIIIDPAVDTPFDPSDRC